MNVKCPQSGYEFKEITNFVFDNESKRYVVSLESSTNESIQSILETHKIFSINQENVYDINWLTMEFEGYQLVQREIKNDVMYELRLVE